MKTATLKTHSPDKCAGQFCCIHNPSAHHMRDWPMNWREDIGVMERICPHGVGHPDPDDAAHNVRSGRECMTAHGCDGCCIPPQLLTDGIPEDDVRGWWVSEKYDGVRAIWTGTELLTRNGKGINAPAWFTDGLPKGVRLDGELWMGRGTFDKLVSVIQKKGSDWAGVRYMVFDLAEPGTFEDRMDILAQIPLPPHVAVAPHFALTGHEALDRFEADIVRHGGEGCVIRRPGCLYRPGRACDVIKIKRLVADVERWQG